MIIRWATFAKSVSNHVSYDSALADVMIKPKNNDMAGPYATTKMKLPKTTTAGIFIKLERKKPNAKLTSRADNYHEGATLSRGLVQRFVGKLKGPSICLHGLLLVIVEEK